MTPRDLKIWNDAVRACRQAAMAEVDAIEAESADGMPNPARAVVRAVGALVGHEVTNDSKHVMLTANDFPSLPETPDA